MVVNDTKIKTLKIRIFPNQKQVQLFNRWFGHSRLIYNNSLFFLNHFDNSPILYTKDDVVNYTQFNINNIDVRQFIRNIDIKKEFVNNEELIHYEFKQLNKFPEWSDNWSLPSRDRKSVV